jgi:hypothetical protein
MSDTGVRPEKFLAAAKSLALLQGLARASLQTVEASPKYGVLSVELFKFSADSRTTLAKFL